MITVIFIAVLGGFVLGFAWLVLMDIAIAGCIMSETLKVKNKNGSEK